MSNEFHGGGVGRGLKQLVMEALEWEWNNTGNTFPRRIWSKPPEDMGIVDLLESREGKFGVVRFKFKNKASLTAALRHVLEDLVDEGKLTRFKNGAKVAYGPVYPEVTGIGSQP